MIKLSRFAILFFSFIISFSALLANPAQLTDDFILITTKAGLSNNKISDIVQDKYGYIWIGTEDGLNRYDGYSITKYMFNIADSTSIAGNNISKLYIDSNDDLWVGTRYSGLSKYNRDANNFMNFHMKSKEPNGFSVSFYR